MARPLALTNKRRDAITEAMLVGATMEVAADAAGIGTSTLYAWLARAREVRSELEAGAKPSSITKADKGRLELLEAVEKARATDEVNRLRRISAAAEDDWKADAWMLERSRPQRYARVSRHEVMGQDGGPIAVDTTPRQMLAEKLAEMAERMADAPTPDDPEAA